MLKDREGRTCCRGIYRRRIFTVFRCSFSFQMSKIYGKTVRQLWEYKLCTNYIFNMKISRNSERFGLKELKWQTESNGIISRTFVHGEEKCGKERGSARLYREKQICRGERRRARDEESGRDENQSLGYRTTDGLRDDAKEGQERTVEGASDFLKTRPALAPAKTPLRREYSRSPNSLRRASYPSYPAACSHRRRALMSRGRKTRRGNEGV